MLYFEGSKTTQHVEGFRLLDMALQFTKKILLKSFAKMVGFKPWQNKNYDTLSSRILMKKHDRVSVGKCGPELSAWPAACQVPGGLPGQAPAQDEFW
jgi:hypothetical protein